MLFCHINPFIRFHKSNYQVEELQMAKAELVELLATKGRSKKESQEALNDVLATLMIY